MAKQSLAAQSGVLSSNLTLPGVFSAPAPALVGRALSPYITFAHPNRKDEWKKLQDKFGTGVAEGEMYLIESDRQSKLDPAKLSLMCYQQFWAMGNAAGEITTVSFGEVGDPYKEHIEAVVLVYFDDRIVPANVEFRTTKCPAAHALSGALLDCQTPGWADKSPAHRESLAVPQPFARFFGLVTLQPARTSKKSGMPYRATSCSIQPTGVAEVRLLKAFSESPDAQRQLDEAAKRFTSRVDDMKAKMPK